MSPVIALLRRDLLLAWRRKSDATTALGFFVIVASLFPLAVGADATLLRAIGPGVIWVGALLATLLGLPRLFAADQDDGTLEQMLLAPQALPVMVMAKIAAHWIVCGLPLCLVAPVLGLQYGLPTDALLVLVAGLLLGTPIVCLLAAIGAALTLGLRGGGVLVSVVVLPLDVPVLILGAGAVDATLNGLGAQAHLSLLGALLIVFLLATPWVVAFALRIASD